MAAKSPCIRQAPICSPPSLSTPSGPQSRGRPVRMMARGILEYGNEQVGPLASAPPFTGTPFVGPLSGLGDGGLEEAWTFEAPGRGLAIRHPPFGTPSLLTPSYPDLLMVSRVLAGSEGPTVWVYLIRFISTH